MTEKEEKIKYQGSVVAESLLDNQIFNELEILDSIVTDEEDPTLRWHIYKVRVTREDIERLAQNIKPGWYMHFWQGREVVAIFAGQKFEFNYDDKKSWQPAIAYGLSVGIPLEQLDFSLDEKK